MAPGSPALAIVQEAALLLWGSLRLLHFREAAANVLTIAELDPNGKIPEFKFCAVRLEV
ncbi:MAG TPA: hypothetical protein VKE74_05270 [Gemmataceae bacterium]|nr:hypothetical protein [Gemmataceae bacterium]